MARMKNASVTPEIVAAWDRSNPTERPSPDDDSSSVHLSPTVSWSTRSAGQASSVASNQVDGSPRLLASLRSSAVLDQQSRRPRRPQGLVRSAGSPPSEADAQRVAAAVEAERAVAGAEHGGERRRWCRSPSPGCPPGPRSVPGGQQMATYGDPLVLDGGHALHPAAGSTSGDASIVAVRDGLDPVAGRQVERNRNGSRGVSARTRTRGRSQRLLPGPARWSTPRRPPGLRSRRSPTRRRDSASSRPGTTSKPAPAR